VRLGLAVCSSDCSSFAILGLGFDGARFIGKRGCPRCQVASFTGPEVVPAAG